MTSLPPAASLGLHRLACSLCARRKVKCDKGDPCSNCLKTHAQCSYEAPAPHRPRKRTADEDLLARLALYEDLLRKHNVDFDHYANTWIPSGLEVKVKEVLFQSPASVMSVTSRPNSKTYLSENTMANGERCLWLDLSSKLKYPPIQSLRHKDDPIFHPTLPLQLIFSRTLPELHELHPEPRHIYRFWQIFVESVNPLTKIVHVPNLQQRILDASWDPIKISKPLTAILFAIYTLAITFTFSVDCQASFGETRGTLLTRYRAATVQALIAAEFLTTKDLEVLQAFVLFLLADPESDLNSTLTGAAIRLGQKMGLHRDNIDPKISFFEKEMRIRLWWQLCGLHSRNRAVSTPGMKLPPFELGDVRLPLNVNDADLHPDMIEPPIEHNGPTEMLCVLMKFEVSNWLRSSPTAAKVFGDIIQGPVKGKMSLELEDEAINELEAIYQEKFLCKTDKRIPLHGLTHAMANLAIARMRFKVHHPRGRTAVDGGEVYVTQKERDMLIDSAMTILEMVNVGINIHSEFSAHLFAHLTSQPQMDACIYVLSELRGQCSEDRRGLAWGLVGNLYDEHPDLIDDGENTFSGALGDLALEAWEAEVRAHGVWDPKCTPKFIQLLWDKRRNGDLGSAQTPTVPDAHGLDGFGLTDDNDLDWEYWNDFLQL